MSTGDATDGVGGHHGSTGDGVHVSVHRDPAQRSALVTVTGEIDVLTGTRLRAALGEELTEPGIKHVAVDLRPVTLMTSTGIAALLDAQSEAKQGGKSLTIAVGDNRAVLRPLQVTGVESLLNLRPDPPTAASNG